MNILLVNPPNSGKSIPEEEFGITNIKTIFRGAPHSLEVIAGPLKNHQLTLADLKVEPDSLWDKISNTNPDIIAFTAMTCEANRVDQLAKEIRKKIETKIVIGGIHASLSPDFFYNDNFDYIVTGLGKDSFRELVKSIELKNYNKHIPGIINVRPKIPFKLNVKKFSKSDLIDDILPDYNISKQFRNQYVMGAKGNKVGFVSTASGCTHRCSFCSVPSLTNGKYITHSVEYILKCIEKLHDIKLIRLVDANTFGDINIARILAKEIINLKINKNFIADIRPDTVVKHPKLLELWKNAGLSTVIIGFEEISDSKLDFFNKKTKVSTNIKALEILRKTGIKVIGDFIISPDYSCADFENLEHFITKHNIDLPMPSIFTPIPGTPVYKELKDKITTTNLDYYTFTNAVMPTKLDTYEFYTKYANLLEKFLKNIKL